MSRRSRNGSAMDLPVSEPSVKESLGRNPTRYETKQSRSGSPTSLSSSPQSPLRPIADTNREVSPTRTIIGDNSSSAGSPTDTYGYSMSSTQHRMSTPKRSRRPSPLLHEIQPPSRRLSAHQVLLLTPFGNALPAAAMGGGVGMGMARGSSSMGRTPIMTLPMRPGGLPDRNITRREVGGIATGLASTMNSQNLLPRGRHHSLAATNIVPSPLSSRPMTTISSENDSSEGSSTMQSRQASDRAQEWDINDIEGDEEMGASPLTVPMARSNSLPVLTLRELKALNEKDGELGIARGGGWAWVSRESGEDDSADESIEDVPLLTGDTITTASSTSLATESGSSFPFVSPFTSFKDPFAPSPPNPGAGMVREGAHFHLAGTPTATTPGYHYSPNYNDSRRVSETTNYGPNSSPGQHEPRRPSAPLPNGTRASISGFNRYTMGKESPIAEIPTPTIADSAANEDLGDKPTFAPTRPRIIRYKSSPTGLNLKVVVRRAGGSVPSALPLEGLPPVPPGGEIPERRRSGPLPRSSKPSLSSRRRLRPRASQGSWAAVDVVNTYTNDLDDSLNNNNNNNISTPSTASSISLRRASAVAAGPGEIVIIEQFAFRNRISEFGEQGRSRFESVDSAFPLFGKLGDGGNHRASLNALSGERGWGGSYP